jgi:hypothetical protein
MFFLPFVYWLYVHSHLNTLEESLMGYKICNVTLSKIALHCFMLMACMDSK